jgi:hypothetical protein
MDEDVRQERIVLLRMRYDSLTRQYASVCKEIEDVRDELEELGVQP